MRFGVSALAVLSCVILAGCVTSTPPIEGEWLALEERPCPDGSILSYETFGDPFVRSWCTGCHSEALLGEERRRGAPDEVNFNTLDQIRLRADRAWLRAADHNRTMPPAGGPGAAERALFGEWLACGAPSRPELDE